MNLKFIFILFLTNILFAFPNCDHGNPEWESLYETVPFENEFNATIAACQIFIDDIEMTTGKIAGFVNDQIKGLDPDGASYFPPGDNNIFEISLWSNQVTGELFSFKYYSEDNNIVIDLDESYIFESNDIVGDGFSPLIFNGSAIDCEYENSNHFSDIVDNTGVSQMIIFSDTINQLDLGDQIGIFDQNGLISEGEECLDILGEVLVGNGEWQNNQLEVVAWSHIDFCNFNGSQFPGFIENNPIKIKIWDVSEQLEYDASFIISEGSLNFQETSFSFVSDICFEEFDECGICDGEGAIYECGCTDISDGECDCEGNIEDCTGECGGDAIIDECGICDGEGILDGECDCEGNIEDCTGECGGDAIIDECGICDGEGANHLCWDGSLVCDPFECTESEFPTPDLFSFNQSLSQAFYYVNEVYIENISLDSNDWLGAFNGDVCVGARKWDIDMCTNNVCDIGVMGNDGSNATEGYMLDGQFPTFKLFDASENIYYDAIPSDNFSFINGGLFVVEQINHSNYYCNDNPSCSGCIDINACNYDSNALIEDTCYYFESDLLQPFNNEVILLGDLPGGTMNFEWTNINQSCYEEQPNYSIQIFDSNNEIIISQSTQENDISISYSDLNINDEEINLYSWNILIGDIVLSDTFSFSIDATMMNINNNKIDNFEIYQNYPNPFNPITYIEFDITNYNSLKINIYDTNGNFIQELVNDYFNPGSYKVYWDGSKFSSGIYFYELQVGNQSLRKKMILIK